MVSNNNTARVHALAPVAAVAAMATLSACGGGSGAAEVPAPTVQPLSAAYNVPAQCQPKESDQ